MLNSQLSKSYILVNCSSECH